MVILLVIMDKWNLKKNSIKDIKSKVLRLRSFISLDMVWDLFLLALCCSIVYRAIIKISGGELCGCESVKRNCKETHGW